VPDVCKARQRSKAFSTHTHCSIGLLNAVTLLEAVYDSGYVNTHYKAEVYKVLLLPVALSRLSMSVRTPVAPCAHARMPQRPVPLPSSSMR
jgi:hypothetical protein